MRQNHRGAGGNRTPVQQSENGPDTTIPDFTPTQVYRRVGCSPEGGPRIVFPNRQRSFSPSAVFPAVIPHFCCRAVMDWPRATFLLTMTLRSSEMNQAARANCSSAILVGAPFSESEQLGSQTRPTVLMSKPVSPVKRYVKAQCTADFRQRRGQLPSIGHRRHTMAFQAARRGGYPIGFQQEAWAICARARDVVGWNDTFHDENVWPAGAGLSRSVGARWLPTRRTAPAGGRSTRVGAQTPDRDGRRLRLSAHLAWEVQSLCLRLLTVSRHGRATRADVHRRSRRSGSW